jgi:hypothetical protein
MMLYRRFANCRCVAGLVIMDINDLLHLVGSLYLQVMQLELQYQEIIST